MGKSPENAEDLTQGFFAQVLSNDIFAKAEAHKGRLRTLLLQSFKNYSTNEWRKESAAKRGGGEKPLSIDAEPAESWLRIEPAEPTTPEIEFERQWARQVLQQARDQLRANYIEAGKQKDFDAFADQLEIGKSERPHSEIAAELGIDAASARFVGFKLRKRFRELLEQAVADTVATPEEAADELQHLMSVF